MQPNTKTFKDFVELSVNAQETTEHDCDIDLNIESETWRAYEVSVSHRDLLFNTDKGTVTYLVDSYGDRHIGVLHDWETDED